MGNRAVITFNTARNAPAIYLHWNGGRASVQAFIEAARALGLRHAPTTKAQAETMDSLAELIARHFFRCNVGLTVYRQQYGSTDRDNGDNGVYLLGRDLSIVSRLYKTGIEEINQAKTAAIVEQITTTAPAFN